MILALYELALHPEIQNRLRADIMQVLNKHNGQVTYDGIQEMAYLDMVVSGRWIVEGCITIRTFDCKLSINTLIFLAEMTQSITQNSLTSSTEYGKLQIQLYMKSENVKLFLYCF
jgi:hypothetical protein